MAPNLSYNSNFSVPSDQFFDMKSLHTVPIRVEVFTRCGIFCDSLQLFKAILTEEPNMQEGKTFGKRFEKKYLLPKERVSILFSDNSPKEFVADHFSPNTEYTLIENTYFDSPKLDSYHQSIDKSPERMKLRIRSYAQDGKKEKFLFIEIKSKKDKATSKKRIVFMKKWLKEFLMTGNCPMSSLYKLNSGKKKKYVLNTFNEIHNLIHNLGYGPVLKGSYKRYAFRLNDDDTVRVTIDSNLNFYPIVNFEKPNAKYTKSIEKEQVIVEVKYQEKASLYRVSELLGFVEKASGFSKYCYGISNSYDKAKKIPISINLGENALSFLKLVSSN